MMSTNPDRPVPPRRSGFQIQAAAIRALFLRELQTRFGGYRLGYFWAIMEPGMHVLFMVLLLSTVMGRTIPGMSYGLFLVSGILPWFMFSNIITRALGAVSANKGLFNYRPVKPIDAVIARAALELSIYFWVYVVMLMVLAWMGEPVSMSNIPLLLLTWSMLWLLSFGISLVMMVLGHYSEEVSKVVSIATRILYFTSGILYSVHAIPQQYQIYVLWNPVLHAIEYIRHCISPAYPADHISLAYLTVTTIVMLFVGLLLYKYRERRMMTST